MSIFEKKFFNIERGEDKNIDVYLIDKDLGEPIDLSAADEVSARFKNEDGTITELLLSNGDVEVLSVAGAKVRAKLLNTDTDVLEIGANQDFEFEVDVAGVITIFKFERALTVKAKIA